MSETKVAKTFKLNINKELKEKKQNSKKLEQPGLNEILIEKARIEERLENCVSQLQESKEEVSKLETKIDEVNEENSQLSAKNVKLEVEDNWQKRKIKELEKENEKLKRLAGKNKS
ncbi:5528_t:CDS:2 [Cetraspora pellucida]|uniref:5528_t:CDS:1 n=1 Tax=Cetraspora pellucida TaxID=1433469 RepID=A0ACA9LIS7_9GLOM|nr:5528_t:CDS:2 [Cetraspora pellucida]